MVVHGQSCPTTCPSFCNEEEIKCPDSVDTKGCPQPGPCLPKGDTFQTNYLDKWTTHIYSLNGRRLGGCTMSSSMWTRRNKVSKRIFGQWLSTSGQVLVHDWTEHVHDLSTSVSTRHSSLWGRWQWPISVLWRHVQWLLSNT